MSSVSAACILDCVCACLAQSVMHDCSPPPFPQGSALPSHLFTLRSLEHTDLPPSALPCHEAGRVGEADSDGEPSAVVLSSRGAVLDNWTHVHTHRNAPHHTAPHVALTPVLVLQRWRWECTGWISMFHVGIIIVWECRGRSTEPFFPCVDFVCIPYTFTVKKKWIKVN